MCRTSSSRSSSSDGSGGSGRVVMYIAGFLRAALHVTCGT